MFLRSLFQPTLQTRAAQVTDRSALERLLREAQVVHTHLDWRPPHGWLGESPFYLAATRERLAGALAAPPDPPDVAWIRLATVAGGYSAPTVLDLLWPPARQALAQTQTQTVNCMLLDHWLTPHLQRWGYELFNDVVILSRPRGARPLRRAAIPDLALRPIQAADLSALVAVDNAAFAPPWQYSRGALQEALGLAALATVAEVAGEVVGYQISSGGRNGGHLARLAVRPDWQGYGIGRGLVAHLIEFFESLGAPVITVNTQRDNQSSLAVYHAAGFQLTQDHCEVWQYQFAERPPA
jgi:ribosomal-protein-alanine N-acetyltransferase